MIDYDSNLMDFIITKKNDSSILKKNTFSETIIKKKHIFLNLKKDGLIFLKWLEKNSIKYDDIIIQDLTIYAIYLKIGSVKCYTQFIENYENMSLFEIESKLDFIEKNTKLDFNINFFQKKFISLGSIGIHLLKLTSCNNNIFRVLNNNIESYIRKAYFGGRCEIISYGLYKNVLYYDFPHMYGNIFREEFPIKEGEFFLNKNKLSIKGLYGFIEVTVNQNMRDFPVLPHKHPLLNNIIYVNGVFRGVYWYEELELFLEMGGSILKIHSYYIFKESSSTYKTTAETLINLKKSKGELFNYKLILNSIYGKLASKTYRFHNQCISIGSYEDLLILKNIRRFSYASDKALIETNKILENKNERNLVTSAVITSKARIKLYRLLLDLKINKNKILYYDTDSVFIQINKKKTDNTFKVVEWKEQYETVCFYNKKKYLINPKIVNKVNEKPNDFRKYTYKSSSPFTLRDGMLL